MNLREELRRHFQAAGFRFGLSPDKIDRELRRLMGQERFTEYLHLCGSVHNGESLSSELYLQPRSAREANLLMSQQADTSLTTATHLYSSIFDKLQQGASAVDLGCWTGTLASFIAQQHPLCQIAGVDSVARLVEIAGSEWQFPNLSFYHWDYSEPPPKGFPAFDVLVSSLGVDFIPLDPSGQRGGWPLDWSDLKDSRSYRIRFREAHRFFANWRVIANPDASLVAVLRIGDVQHAIAVLDAAASAGWHWQSDRSQFIEANGDRFPCLFFDSSAPLRIDVGMVLSWWSTPAFTSQQPRVFDGAAALVWRRALGTSELITIYDQVYGDGNTRRFELGRSGELVYRFEIATNGDMRFSTASLSCIEELLADAPDPVHDAAFQWISRQAV